MDRTTLRETFFRIIEETTGEQKPGLDEATELRIGLGLDSVDMVHLAIQSQTEIGVELTVDDQPARPRGIREAKLCSPRAAASQWVL